MVHAAVEHERDALELVAEPRLRADVEIVLVGVGGQDLLVAVRAVERPSPRK
jgi:hypothetical protein